MMSNKKRRKELAELLHDCEEFFKEKCVPRQKREMKLKKFKKELRGIYKSQKDPIAKSIRNGWRAFYSSDGESLKEYRIFKDNGETDEEIKELLDEWRIENYSAFDCTGRLYTSWIHWSRTPAGIVVVHCKHLDV